MASNYTPNYSLCQWEADDQVLRTEFNADNAKIDAALKSLSTTVNGKASTSALNSLKTTVNGKASQSDLDSLKSTVNSLSGTVSGQGTTLTKKGNCQIEVTSYTGNGAATRTHTFSRKPLMFFISGDAQITVAYGCTRTYNHGDSSFGVGVAWSGNSVTLTSITAFTTNAPSVIANVNGVKYQMTAFYDLSA